MRPEPLPQGLPILPPRDPHSHKGTYGRALLVGGSLGMPGSISLSGRACLKGGAGLVTVAVPDAIINTVATFDPAYMTWPLPTDREGRIPLHARNKLRPKVEQADCMAIGPGLGQSQGLFLLVSELYEQFKKPLVVDADGLNLLSQREVPLAGAAGPRVLTPHLGEFRRLTRSPELTMQDAAQEAERLAAQHNVVIVLKGAQTLVTDGKRQWHNPTGNPGLATGGTGDVLTGLLTGVLAQGLAAYEAAVLATYLHGLAADIAVERTSQPGLTATDLVAFLETAWLHYAQQRDQNSADGFSTD